ADNGSPAPAIPSIRSAIAPRRAISACARQGTSLSAGAAAHHVAQLICADNINHAITRLIATSPSKKGTELCSITEHCLALKFCVFGLADCFSAVRMLLKRLTLRRNTNVQRSGAV